MRAAIRIVLKALYDTRNTVLVALEVDNAVALFVTATLVTNRNSTIVVTTAFRRLFVEQRTVRLAFVQTGGLYSDDKSASS